MTTTSSPILTTLRLSAVALAVLAVLQAILAAVFSYSTTDLRGAHSVVAMVIVVVAVVAAVAAFLWAKQGGSPALRGHAIGMAVFSLVQFALGEMDLTTVHVVFGVLFLLGAAALAVLSYTRPNSQKSVLRPHRA